MSEALPIAIRAEEAARSAHHRLDRMNGSIDRLAGEVSRANATGAEILRRLDRQDGFTEGAAREKRSVLDSKRWVIGLAATFLGGGLVTAVFTVLVRSHG